MFTGLIQDIGQIVAVEKTASDVTLTIKTSQLKLDKLAIGASVACNGVCLTLIEKTNDTFKVQVSAETLAKTTVQNWSVEKTINLEPSLKLGDELGGHLVYGHVDGVGKCQNILKEGDCWRFTFDVPEDLAPFIATKGSVSIDGISLTVNEVSQNRFGVMIIPHTFEQTTIKNIKAGDSVNIEIDMLARYVARLQEFK